MGKLKIKSDLINWNLISCQNDLPIKFMEEYKSYLNWQLVSKTKLSEEKIIRFKNYLKWHILVQYNKLSENFIIKYINYIPLDYLCTYQQVSLEFLRQFKDALNWDTISVYQKLNDDLLIEFKDKINWTLISQFQKLSENFIERFSDELDWDLLSTYQKLSENFIRKHQNRVNWMYISRHQKLSEKFIREFKNQIYWCIIASSQKLSFEFALEFIKRLNKTVIDEQNYTDQQKLILLKKLTNDLDFFEKINIFLNANYSSIEDFYNDLIQNYSQNPNKYDKVLTSQLFNSYRRNSTWDYLSKLPDLPYDFIHKYENEIDWENYLNYSKNTDLNFLLNFLHHKEVVNYLIRKKLISLSNIEIY